MFLLTTHHASLSLPGLQRPVDKRGSRWQPPPGASRLCFRTQVLTHVGDVQREPEEEGVADQLGEQQTQRELHHALAERDGVHPDAPGGFAEIRNPTSESSDPIRTAGSGAAFSTWGPPCPCRTLGTAVAAVKGPQSCPTRTLPARDSPSRRTPVSFLQSRVSKDATDSILTHGNLSH